MKLISLVLLLCAANVCYADSAKYLAQSKDTNFSSLIARWAKQDKQTFKWQASFDVPIADFESVNTNAELASATGMDDALFRILSIMGRISTDTNGATLVACHFPDDEPAWVVRDSTQPPCDRPLK